MANGDNQSYYTPPQQPQGSSLGGLAQRATQAATPGSTGFGRVSGGPTTNPAQQPPQVDIFRGQYWHPPQPSQDWQNLTSQIQHEYQYGPTHEPQQQGWWDWLKQGAKQGAGFALNDPRMQLLTAGLLGPMGASEEGLLGLATASRQEAAGLPRGDILRGTGWSRDPYSQMQSPGRGVLQSEIGNNPITNPNAVPAIRGLHRGGELQGALSQFIHDPDMQKAYPELYAMMTRYQKPRDISSLGGAGYIASKEAGTPGSPGYPEYRFRFQPPGPIGRPLAETCQLIAGKMGRYNPQYRFDLPGLAEHEVAHGVQDVEGYPMSGMFNQPPENYFRHVEEVGARAQARRMGMGQEERRADPLYESIDRDIPYTHQIGPSGGNLQQPLGINQPGWPGPGFDMWSPGQRQQWVQQLRRDLDRMLGRPQTP